MENHHIKRFGSIELHFDSSNTLSTSEVALGYGISADNVRNQKYRHQDEILNNVHFIELWDNKFKRNTIRWTLNGIHMLGFFIKSDEAKQFRQYVAKLLSEIKVGNVEVKETLPRPNDPYIYKLERENIELKRAMNRMTHNAELPDAQLKRTLTKELDEMSYQLTTQFTQILEHDIKCITEAIETSVLMMHKKITQSEQKLLGNS